MPPQAVHADALRLMLGGVEVHHLDVVGAVDGVRVLQAAARNGPGAGRLRSNGTMGERTWLSWQAPGSSTPGPEEICAEGTWLLEDGEDPNRWIRVDVRPDLVQVSPQETPVYLAEVYQSLGLVDLSAVQAAAGDAVTLTYGLANDSAIGVSRLRLWLDPATADCELSPDGAAWSSPTTEAAALALGDVAPGAVCPLYLRRTVPPAAAFDPHVRAVFHWSFDGL